jgi:hypothetical protein
MHIGFEERFDNALKDLQAAAVKWGARAERERLRASLGEHLRRALAAAQEEWSPEAEYPALVVKELRVALTEGEHG